MIFKQTTIVTETFERIDRNLRIEKLNWPTISYLKDKRHGNMEKYGNLGGHIYVEMLLL